MKIEYRQGEMIVTHGSGHVDRYQRADLELERVNLAKKRADNERTISRNNVNIANIISSTGVI